MTQGERAALLLAARYRGSLADYCTLHEAHESYVMYVPVAWMRAALDLLRDMQNDGRERE